MPAQRLIMMVAQEPFESNTNSFCKLIPVCDLDGLKTEDGEFPNDGEVWWMLTPQNDRLAQPGQLVVGNIEIASQFSKFNEKSSLYQVVRGTLRALDLQEGLQILSLETEELRQIEDLAEDFVVQVQHPITSKVLVKWRDRICGPFLATQQKRTSEGPLNQYLLEPVQNDRSVYTVGTGDFSDIVQAGVIKLDLDVSENDQRRSESSQKARVTAEVLLGSGYGELVSANPERITLEPLSGKLRRYARNILTRKKRQEFYRLLGELESGGKESSTPEEIERTIQHVRRNAGRLEERLDSIANAMLESGLLGEDRLTAAEKRYAERYVQKHAAELQAYSAEQVVKKRGEISKLESDLEGLRQRIEREERVAGERVQKDLDAKRTAWEKERDEERRSLKVEKKEIERQQAALRENLQEVTTELKEAGDEVVNRFLAIAPLVGALTSNQGQASEPSTAEPLSVEPESEPYAGPVFLDHIHPYTESEISEETFIKRFFDSVQSSGYRYRDVDLLRFHLSVKSGHLTILGGPSGTGKSSLPILYSRALAGEETALGRPDCLMVNVNPSWMEIRDLIGHMNTLEGRFYPAESGLYELLIDAELEYRKYTVTSGIQLVCLDEMNLAHVEHYFSDLMMVLERDIEHRKLHCFSSKVSSSVCPFREWGQIRIAPTLRFVGTVNFDETTRLLSDRLLDRANLIELGETTLPDVAAHPATGWPTCEGPGIKFQHLQSWSKQGPLPPKLARMLDDMRPHLAAIGANISPRIYVAICSYVNSAGAHLSPEQAFDYQVTQRVLSKVRGAVPDHQLEALDNLTSLVENWGLNESHRRLQFLRQFSMSRSWFSEE